MSNNCITFTSTNTNTMEDLVGKRIRCDYMNDDPNPVEPGTEGTVTHIGGGVISVNWDNGRTLGLIEGYDEYTII